MEGMFTFHGIGQGLFHSGIIRSENENGVFRFVYDCGSSSTGRTQQRALNPKNWFTRYISGYGAKTPRLDLLVISHFHADHFNGIPHLPNDIGTLVIPYCTFLERILLIASSGPVLTPVMAGLVIDPIAYFSENKKVAQIILLQGSDGDSPFEEDPETPMGEDDFFGLRWVKKTQPITPEELTELGYDGFGATIVTKAEGKLTGYLGNPRYKFKFWMPATKTNLDNVNQFWNALESIHSLEDFTWWKTKITRITTLNKIRAIYQIYFPNQLNETSICLWHGPVIPPKDEEIRFRHFFHHGLQPYHWDSQGFFRYRHQRSIGTLLTGDQSFKEPQKAVAFANFYARERRWPNVFQIPHHGSKDNFTSSIMPAECSMGILSYGAENTYGHPAASVREDLFLHGHDFFDLIRGRHFIYGF